MESTMDCPTLVVRMLAPILTDGPCSDYLSNLRREHAGVVVAMRELLNRPPPLVQNDDVMEVLVGSTVGGFLLGSYWYIACGFPVVSIMALSAAVPLISLAACTISNHIVNNRQYNRHLLLVLQLKLDWINRTLPTLEAEAHLGDRLAGHLFERLHEFKECIERYTIPEAYTQSQPLYEPNSNLMPTSLETQIYQQQQMVQWQKSWTTHNFAMNKIMYRV